MKTVLHSYIFKIQLGPNWPRTIAILAPNVSLAKLALTVGWNFDKVLYFEELTPYQTYYRVNLFNPN